MTGAEQAMSNRGITPGTSVRWSSVVQERFGVYAGIEQAFASSKPKAIVHAMNGRLVVDPFILIAAPEVQDPFAADYQATYGTPASAQ
jgi:hypothetical protein